MRYLKSYKLFESLSKEKVDEIHQDINDVLEDLRDDGFECYCNVGYGYGPSFELRISKDADDSIGYGDRTFEFSDIEGAMKRIYTILKDNSNNIRLYFIKDEKEYEYKLSGFGFGLLKGEFSEYYGNGDGDGFIIDFLLDHPENWRKDFE